jgi:hypothetical protein
VLDLRIKTIPHDRQRYQTVGDYVWAEDGHLQTTVTVSEMGQPLYELTVAIHELLEMYRCRQMGISEAEVAAFDREYERNRPPGDTSEPGDAQDAPYREAHQGATAIEQQVIAYFGLDWDVYERAVESL